MLTTTVTDEQLQAVAGRDPQILDILRRVDRLELPQVARCAARSTRVTYCSCQMRSVSLLPNDLITRAGYDAERH